MIKLQRDQKVKLRTLRELCEQAENDDELDISLEEDPGVSEDMEKYFGKVVTINRFHNLNDDIMFYIEEDLTDDWIWSKLWLEDDSVSKYLLESELFTI